MKTLLIQDKLKALNIDPNSIILGDFDQLGEFTAKRTRTPDSEHYRSSGFFYRANYERGILISSLIKKYELSSFLEIGFGRGYSTLCAAKAFYDLGISANIVTIDPALEENYVNELQKILPKEWFSCITFIRGTSQQALEQVTDKFDLIYIDGDHSYEATKHDWLMTKDKFKSFLLFDDYKLSEDPHIKCRKAIDEIDHELENCHEPELIKMDRRMFVDDRRLSNDEIDYGQVLFTRKDVNTCLDDEW
jgi:hypothetical protein